MGEDACYPWCAIPGHVVYFLQRPTDGAIKIGRSRRLHKRRRTIESTNGQRLHVVGALAVSRSWEAALHRRFRHLRLPRCVGAGREWFRDDSELRQYICGQVDYETCLYGGLPDWPNLPRASFLGA